MWDLNLGESFLSKQSVALCWMSWKWLVRWYQKFSIYIVRAKQHAMYDFFGDLWFFSGKLWTHIAWTHVARQENERLQHALLELCGCPERQCWIHLERKSIVSEPCPDGLLSKKPFLGSFVVELGPVSQTIQDLHFQSYRQAACNTQSIGVNNLWLVKCVSPLAGSNLSCPTFQAGTAINVHGTCLNYMNRCRIYLPPTAVIPSSIVSTAGNRSISPVTFPTCNIASEAIQVWFWYHAKGLLRSSPTFNCEDSVSCQIGQEQCYQSQRNRGRRYGNSPDLPFGRGMTFSYIFYWSRRVSLKIEYQWTHTIGDF